MKLGRKFLIITVLLFVWIIIGQCTKLESERILFDFESDSELDRFHWRCHTLFSMSDEHATHGTKSVKLQLFPSDYPGLAPKLNVNNWSSYTTFSLDVYNVQDKGISLTIRIDDDKNDPDYPDRYNKTFYLRPGANAVVIPLNTLETSGPKRKLNLKNIYKIIIFMAQPAEQVVLYFDYLRLKR
jgi:hypothetical protein